MSKCYHCEAASHACGERCIEHYQREVERLEGQVTKVEKRDATQKEALKAAKNALEFSHGYSIKGATMRLGKAYKLVATALKD